MSRSPIIPVVAALMLATACQQNAGPATPPATPVAEPAPPVPAPVPAKVAEQRLRGQFVIGKDGYGITLCGEPTQRIVSLGPQANALGGELARNGPREFFVGGFGRLAGAVPRRGSPL